MARPLTDHERELFDALRDADYTNFALVQTTFDGIETAVITVMDEDSETAVPVAVLVTDEMFGKIADPFAEVGE